MGVWLSSQQRAYKNGELTLEQVERLEAIGTNWSIGMSAMWQENFEAANQVR